MHAELNNIYPVLDTMKADGAPAAILGVLMNMPFKWLILPLFIFVGLLNLNLPNNEKTISY